MRWVGFVLVLFGLVFAKTAVVVGLDADPPNLDPVFSSALCGSAGVKPNL
jgi:hypothetical protein